MEFAGNVQDKPYLRMAAAIVLMAWLKIQTMIAILNNLNADLINFSIDKPTNVNALMDFSGFLGNVLNVHLEDSIIPLQKPVIQLFLHVQTTKSTPMESVSVLVEQDSIIKETALFVPLLEEDTLRTDFVSNARDKQLELVIVVNALMEPLLINSEIVIKGSFVHILRFSIRLSRSVNVLPI